MNKTYVTVAVLVLVVLGGLFIFKGRTLEAPGNMDGANARGSYDVKKMEGAKTGGMNMTPNPIPTDYNTPVTTTTAPTKEFTVTGQNFSFTPSTLSVKKGDLVKITFKNAAGFHDFRIDEFKVATHQIQGGNEETVQFIADKTGSFQYYCSVGSHRAMGMWGTLTVAE